MENANAQALGFIFIHVHIVELEKKNPGRCRPQSNLIFPLYTLISEQ